MVLLTKIRRYIIDILKTFYLYRYYRLSDKIISKENRRTIVSMIDGRIPHGGLSDRICGIVSTYNFCKEHKLKFKLFFNYPYNILKYLEPNNYDWVINEEEITYNPLCTKFKHICNYGQGIDYKTMKQYIDFRMIGLQKLTLMYSNMYYFKSVKEFQICFHELFKPSIILQKAIENNISAIGEDYVSITFRFQQLLGDFKESGFKVLETEEERQNLINICLKAVEYVHSLHNCKVLVTSESSLFLNIVNKTFDYVYVIPGKVVHIDFIDAVENISNDSLLKSFVDFFMLSKANTIYLANIKPLYKSSFPKVASFINSRPLKFIHYENEIFSVVDKTGSIYA
jgi:hypothetical protein